MSRTNIVLLAVAAVQIVLVLVTGGDGGGGDRESMAGAGGKAFGTVDAATVARIEINDGDNQLAVERIPGKDGKEDTWGMTSKDGFPVRATEVTTVVNATNKLTRGRIVTKKKKNLTGLGVSDDRFHRHVVLEDTSGGTLADFYLGEGKQSDQVFFRKAGEESAWHAAGASAWEFPASSSSWVDTAFTDISFDDVVRLKLERESGAIEMERQERPKTPPAPKEGEKKEGEPAPAPAPAEGEKKEGEAGDKPAGEAAVAPKKEEPPKVETETVWVLTFPDQKDLDKSKVETLVRGLCKLYLGDPIGKTEKEEHGFAKPSATATLTLKDGAVRTITVGKKRDKENDYFAKRSGFEYIVTLRSYSVDDSFLKKLDDLLPKKDEPKEEPKDGHEGHDHK